MGVLLYKNGDKYEGRFAEGIKHGLGTYTWSTGQKEIGYWEGNEMKNKVNEEEMNAYLKTQEQVQEEKTELKSPKEKKSKTKKDKKDKKDKKKDDKKSKSKQ
jgi:hypothetical protein